MILVCERRCSRSSPSSRSRPRRSRRLGEDDGQRPPVLCRRLAEVAPINKKPFRATGPLSDAHSGLKNVYASKRKVGSKYPNGTVIVKTIVKPGTTYVGQFATMRKAGGRWRFVEYERSSATSRYSLLAQGSLCQSYVMAKSNDFVFTKR